MFLAVARRDGLNTGYYYIRVELRSVFFVGSARCQGCIAYMERLLRELVSY